MNHLGPLLLTLELLPLILDTAATTGDGRIVFVSSMGHSLAAPFDVTKLNLTEEQYGRMKAYGNSKLCNVSTFCVAAKTVELSSIEGGKLVEGELPFV